MKGMPFAGCVAQFDALDDNLAGRSGGVEA